MSAGELVWVILLATGVYVAGAALIVSCMNLALCRRPRAVDDPARCVDGASSSVPIVSVCIPARNEESNIGACVESLLGNRVPLEVLVYNDESEDRTGEIVDSLIAKDPRVRTVPTLALPPGWNGKQHACEQLGRRARGAWLLFTDADVRFQPECLERSLAEAERLKVNLISTVPRQVTGTLVEKLVVPFIQVIMFSYLPFPMMRWGRSPTASAGCGQFLLIQKEWWQKVGGHAAFKASRHDGIRLPRNVRRAGGRSDLFDGTELLSCRMYRGARACWNGFAKNAYEGLGSPILLIVFSIMHVLGHILPWVYLAWAAIAGEWSRSAGTLAIIAIAAAYLSRIVLAIRFRHSWLGVALHPIAISIVTLIQWHSFHLSRRGGLAWKGRAALAA